MCFTLEILGVSAEGKIEVSFDEIFSKQ
jgi:hypothetical protein